MDFGDGQFTIRILNTDQIVHNMRELIPIAGMIVRWLEWLPTANTAITVWRQTEKFSGSALYKIETDVRDIYKHVDWAFMGPVFFILRNDFID